MTIRGGLLIGLIVAVCATGVLRMQALPTVRIGLSGTLVSPLDHPATISVALPPGYGLSAAERRASWEPLNDESGVEVPLGDASFVVELPPVTYCTHMWLWQRVPPAPPPRFILRFSDAPGEEYVIWGSQYIVLDAEHHQIRQDIAAWGLEIGPLRYRGGLGRDALWLLDVSLTPRRRGSSASTWRNAVPADFPVFDRRRTKLMGFSARRCTATEPTSSIRSRSAV